MNMKIRNDIESIIIYHNATLSQGLEKLNSNAGSVLLVVNANNRLIGTVTDGDVRRALLRIRWMRDWPLCIHEGYAICLW